MKYDVVLNTCQMLLNVLLTLKYVLLIPRFLYMLYHVGSHVILYLHVFLVLIYYIT